MMKKGWEYKKFKEIFPIKMGKTPPRGDKSCWDTEKRGKNKWVSIADISNNEGKIIYDTKEYISDSAAKKINKADKGSLLMSFKLSIGKMAFAGDNLYTNEAIISIPDTSIYNLRFIYYYLLSYDWKSLTDGNEKVKGATLNKTSIGNIKLPTLSLSEQKEIVNYLDSSFAKIDKLKENAAKNLDEAKSLFQSALKDALEPKKGWEKKTIGEMGEIKVGPFGSMLHKKDYIVGGTPLINPMHISNGKIFINPAFSVCQKKCEELSSYIMQQNDIVIGRRGEIGRCAVVGILENGCVCGTGCMFLRTNISICNPFFIQQLLSSDYIRKKLEEISGGATMKNLSSTALSRFAISIPPLSEQQEIVSRLDSLNEKVNTLQQNYSRICDECDALKQAILRQVFE